MFSESKINVKSTNCKYLVLSENKVIELFCMADDLASPIFNFVSF